MDVSARIGPSIQIKGDVTAREPLSIAGQVNGTIDVEGHPLTVDAGGRVDATVSAHTIVVGGAVQGSLLAESRIVIRETATISGEVQAPAVSLSDGAKVNGRIETAGRNVKTVVPIARPDAAPSAA